MNEELSRKVDFAIKLLRNIPQDGPIELCYSGGKDSDVILELAKMAGIPFEAIYKNTTIDRPGTIQHCLNNGAKIRRPNKTFLQLVRENGMPSRFVRFCCRYLKEYKIRDRAILGIRRAESVSRAKLYKEPERCRVFSAKEKVRQYLPILDWTIDDVAEFVENRGLKCHPHYYDEAGAFHPERRIGCLGCPLRSDKGKGDYVQYPKLLRLVIGGGSNTLIITRIRLLMESISEAHTIWLLTSCSAIAKMSMTLTRAAVFFPM